MSCILFVFLVFVTTFLYVSDFSDIFAVSIAILGAAFMISEQLEDIANEIKKNRR